MRPQTEGEDGGGGGEKAKWKRENGKAKGEKAEGKMEGGKPQGKMRNQSIATKRHKGTEILFQPRINAGLDGFFGPQRHRGHREIINH